MLVTRLLATVVVVVWILTLLFLAGPVRWELAHTYAHAIGSMRDALPLPTVHVALPILGLGETTPGSLLVRGLFWAFAWSLPIVVLAGVWRSRGDVMAWLMLGGMLYLSVMAAALAVVAFSLWLPFALL